MNDPTKAIYRLLRSHARNHGYSSQGRYAWARDISLARIVSIQACAWSDGLYFNTGLVVLSEKTVLPCGEVKWHYQGRPDGKGTAFFEAFRVCGLDANAVDLDEMSRAIEWLLGFMSEQWRNEDVVATLALDYKSWMHQCGGVSGTLLSWARTRLLSA